MSFLRSLLHRLGFGPPRDSGASAGSADGRDLDVLERSIRERIDADDAERLAALLDDRREDGKRVIRRWEERIPALDDDADRREMARRLTALVVLYRKAFDDPEPMSWFRAPRDESELAIAAGRLREAKERLVAGEVERAVALAQGGLDALSPLEDDSRAAALRSALYGVLGGSALRTDDLHEADVRFARSLEEARRCDERTYLGAALLNRIDFLTRRRAYDDAEALLDESAEAVRDTELEGAYVKVLIERGLAQTRDGALPAAVATFDRAVDVRPDWPFAWYQRGWARFAAGDSGGALDDFRECAERAPVFFTVQREIRCLEDVARGRLPLDAYRTYCAVREQVRQRPAAVQETAERLVARHPDFSPAHLLKAEARLAAGDPAGASAAAREALRHDPDPDTASAALFVEWNTARAREDRAAMDEAAERLTTGYPDHPASGILARIREAPDRDHRIRWTFGLDGALHFDDTDPAAGSAS